MTRKSMAPWAMAAWLVSFGVLGRWLQPEWGFTPTVAIALLAGFYFSSRMAAALVPITVLAISNLILPSYYGWGVMAVVYATFLLPVAMGRGLRRKQTYLRLGVCSLAPATIFFVTTNFAVWAFQGMYPMTLAGLGECYAAALPFYRWMLLGDMFFVPVVFASYLLATRVAPTVAPAEVRAG